jgi:hypothetical protein
MDWPQLIHVQLMEQPMENNDMGITWIVQEVLSIVDELVVVPKSLHGTLKEMYMMNHL